MTPSFERPPVVEVALGFAFAPRPDVGFRVLTHVADRWSSEFPSVSELAAIPGEPPQGLIGPMVTFGSGAPPVRLWLENPDSGLLLQIQNDRLILNWRAGAGALAYPGYEDFLRGEYLKRWVQLIDFFRESGMPIAVPQTAEFTYVNQLPVREGEQDHDVLSLLNAQATNLPGEPSFTRLQVARALTSSEDQLFTGQLVVTGEPMQSLDGRFITLSVSTRMQLPQEYDGSRLIQALDSAHDASATAFANATTDRRHEEWGRRDD